MSKRHFIPLWLLACLPGMVAAAPSSNVAWTLETQTRLEAGDIQRGKDLAMRCAGCHGAAGISNMPATPHLAGQAASYTYKQLMDYKDRSRNQGLMSAMVGGLSEAEMIDLAVFYAAQPLPPAVEGLGDDTGVASLLRLGDGPRLIPACSSCHGRHGEGNPRSIGMPSLAGQDPGYLIQTLRAYRAGARNNDVYSVMRAISRELSDAEIKGLAEYYAGQDAGQ